MQPLRSSISARLCRVSCWCHGLFLPPLHFSRNERKLREKRKTNSNELWILAFHGAGGKACLKQPEGESGRTDDDQGHPNTPGAGGGWGVGGVNGARGCVGSPRGAVVPRPCAGGLCTAAACGRRVGRAGRPQRAQGAGACARAPVVQGQCSRPRECAGRRVPPVWAMVPLSTAAARGAHMAA